MIPNPLALFEKNSNFDRGKLCRKRENVRNYVLICDVICVDP